jgi:hypothetical protein
MKQNYLFDYQEFIVQLYNNPLKRKIIEDYLEHIGPIPECLTELNCYKDYISKFDLPPVTLIKPEDSEGLFDFDLLLRLAASSFSCNIKLDLSESDKVANLIIRAETEEQSVEKYLSELWGFQTLRLFEIWIEEQINLDVIFHSDSLEQEGIQIQRDLRLQEWKSRLDEIQNIQLRDDHTNKIIEFLNT